MKKISMILFVSLLLTVALPFMACAEDALPMLTDIDLCEKLIYGSTNSARPIVDRIDDLERTVYGGVYPLSVPERIAQVKSTLLDDSIEKQSLFFQLKADEWVTKKRVGEGPLLPRLQELEKILIGTSNESSLIERINSVSAVCFKDGTVPAREVTITEEDMIVIKFLDEISSKRNKQGDPVRFEAAEDMIVDNVLVVPMGTQATGEITKLKKAKMFGQDGKLELDFKNIRAFDTTELPLMLGEKAAQENKRVAAAAGTSFIGALALGPIGLAGGAFIKGNNLFIGAGTTTYLEIVERKNVIGVDLR